MTRGEGAAVRLALGLLTVLPVRAERSDRVDPVTARDAMLLAPLAGLVLAALLGPVGAVAVAAGLAPLVTAAVGAGGLALLTRGLHLDGLADTADGLGCAGPAEQALAVMRRSDVGAFGVAALVLVLLAQVAAAAQLLAGGHGGAALLGVAAGRLALPVVCRAGVPAARPDGLGAAVAGTVPRGAALAAGASWLVTLAVLGALLGAPPVAVAAATAAGLLAAGLLVRRCVRRFGGVTGDVLGAAVETAQAAYLVALAALVR